MRIGPDDHVFAALAHPARRRMIDLLTEIPGLSVGAMASHFSFSRIAVMKHLRVLERAGLVISEKKGRTRSMYFNPVPIQEIYDRWTDRYSGYWAERMVDIQARVEKRNDKEEPKRA